MWYVAGLASGIVLPAVVGAADTALLVAPEPERDAAMGTELVDGTQAAFRIAEGHHAFTQQLQAQLALYRELTLNAAPADLYDWTETAVPVLKEYAEGLYTDAEFEEKRAQYDFAQPFTKESLLYRELFEKYYPGQARMVADFWMPNRDWEGCQVNDPSARVLSNYGASGK